MEYNIRSKITIQQSLLDVLIEIGIQINGSKLSTIELCKGLITVTY